MRWATYNRLMDNLVAADGVADERLILLAARWLGRPKQIASEGSLQFRDDSYIAHGIFHLTELTTREVAVFPPHPMATVQFSYGTPPAGVRLSRHVCRGVEAPE
jgi:hypothetical protein